MDLCGFLSDTLCRTNERTMIHVIHTYGSYLLCILNTLFCAKTVRSGHKYVFPFCAYANANTNGSRTCIIFSPECSCRVGRINLDFRVNSDADARKISALDLGGLASSGRTNCAHCSTRTQNRFSFQTPALFNSIHN